jgi:NAD(P)-dependent dehydrogenase (short-subunit alcohol dehydrogenase family)
MPPTLRAFAALLFAAAAHAQPARDFPKAPPLPDLAGKVALVTGSTDGLGRDVARRLAAAGYNGSRGYSQSKLAQVMMTIDMAPALEREGVRTYSLHPATTMATTMARALNVTPRSTIAEGVESVVNAIVTMEPVGTYFNQLKPATPHAQAQDPAARAKLRELSERLTRN